MASPRRGASPSRCEASIGGKSEGVVNRGFESRSILPIAKSTIWGLVGHGRAYDDCGRFGWKGCLNVEGHNVPHLDDNSHLGKVYVKGFKRSCDRAECPVCFEKWASRAGRRIEKRLKKWKGGYRRAIHVTASVPSKNNTDKDLTVDYGKLRVLAYRLMKEVGLEGAVCIFHPFRKDARGWYLSPHFHTVGYGWIRGKRDVKTLERGTKEVYEDTGWVIKNVGVRKTIRGTISYQLSHAGFHLKHSTITWFGTLSYNKFHVQIDEDKEVCPVCREKLIMIWFVGTDRPPPGAGDNLL